MDTAGHENYLLPVEYTPPGLQPDVLLAADAVATAAVEAQTEMEADFANTYIIAAGLAHLLSTMLRGFAANGMQGLRPAGLYPPTGHNSSASNGWAASLHDVHKTANGLHFVQDGQSGTQRPLWKK
jgi:hypothetical protein